MEPPAGASELRRLLGTAWEAARAGDRDASGRAWDALRQRTHEGLTASLRREFGRLAVTDIDEAVHDAYVDEWLKLWDRRSSKAPSSESAAVRLALSRVRARVRFYLLEQVPDGRKTRRNKKAEFAAGTVSLDSLMDQNGELALGDPASNSAVGEVIDRDLVVSVLSRVLSRFERRLEKIDEILGALIAGHPSRAELTACLGISPRTLRRWIEELENAFLKELVDGR